MGKLATHLLDIMSGRRPAANVRIDLWAGGGSEGWRFVKTVTTHADGRTGAPLLIGNAVTVHCRAHV
jgi:5-hydroxyisourate hydrolase